jgi:transposase
MSKKIPISKFSKFVLKKKNRYYELSLSIYNTGIKKIKARLLELYPSETHLINNIYVLFSLSKLLLKRNGKSLVVDAAPQKDLKLLTDKNILTDSTTLITNWFKILGAIVSLKASEAQQFWNSQCEEISKKLWFPMKKDLVYQNKSKNNSLKTIQNTSFSINHKVNPDVLNSNETFSPEFNCSVDDITYNGLRALRLKLLPSPLIKPLLFKWGNTTRYVYNKILMQVKANPKLNSATGYNQLNKECITELGNNIIGPSIYNDTNHDDIYKCFGKFIYDWELETPKDIRNGANRDVQKAYVSAWANLHAGNINHFGLDLRKKKNRNTQAMEINSIAAQFSKTGFYIYTNYVKNHLKEQLGEDVIFRMRKNKTLQSFYKKECLFRVDKDSLKALYKLDKSSYLTDKNKLKYAARLKEENGIWYLCICYDAKQTDLLIKDKTCGVDIGINNCYTMYSEDRNIDIVLDHKRIEKIYANKDKRKALYDKHIISKRSYNKSRCRYQIQLDRLVNEMHYKTISFLTKNYTTILLPSFETQDMIGGLNRKVARKMNDFRYYLFKQRLIHKCSIIKNCNVVIVNEAYTSQTCGFCGTLKVSSEPIRYCKKCNISYGRDDNGSRNIYLKHVSMSNQEWTAVVKKQKQ